MSSPQDIIRVVNEKDLSPVSEADGGHIIPTKDKEDSAESPPSQEPAPRSPEERDPNLVTWTGPTDPENPRNWSSTRKRTATVLISLYNVVGPLSSAMATPALQSIQRDLDVSNTVGVMILSIYMLAFSFGPLVTSPASEMFGRWKVLQWSNAVFLVFNTMSGFADTKARMLIYRFLAGMGGCAAQAIGGAQLSDMYTPDERGRAVSLYSVAPFIGPVVGPVVGGALTDKASWRWCFWSVSIFGALVQIACLIFVRESYGPVVLRRRRNRLILETGNQMLRTEHDDSSTTWKEQFWTHMQRPFEYLAKQPIVQIAAVYTGYTYGLSFMSAATMSLVWEDHYGQSPTTASLNFIPGAVAVIIQAQINPSIDKVISKRLTARATDRRAVPEFRLPFVFPATVLVLGGLVWYGWSAQELVNPVCTNVGQVIFVMAVNASQFHVNQYIIDSYGIYAASAMGAATILRGLGGFGVPLLAPVMFERLGFGVGFSILAAVSFAIGMPGAAVLWTFGRRLRTNNPYIKPRRLVP